MMKLKLLLGFCLLAFGLLLAFQSDANSAFMEGVNPDAFPTTDFEQVQATQQPTPTPTPPPRPSPTPSPPPDDDDPDDCPDADNDGVCDDDDDCPNQAAILDTGCPDDDDGGGDGGDEPRTLICIRKIAIGGPAGTFSFSGSLGLFNLDHPVSPIQCFLNIPVGIYTVTEDATPGWTLIGIICGGVDKDGNPFGDLVKNTIDLIARSVTIDFDASMIGFPSYIICTFLNAFRVDEEERDGTIVIRKVVLPGSPNGNFTFSGTLGAFALNVPVSPVAVFGGLAQGVYTIDEDDLPDWALFSVVCGGVDNNGNLFFNGAKNTFNPATKSITIDLDATMMGFPAFIVCIFYNFQVPDRGDDPGGGPRPGQGGTGEAGVLEINELTPGGVADNPNEYYIELATPDQRRLNLTGFALELYEILPDGSEDFYQRFELEGETNDDGLFLVMSEPGVVAGLSDDMIEVQVIPFELRNKNLRVLLKNTQGEVVSTYNHDGTSAPPGAGVVDNAVERVQRIAPDQEGCWLLSSLLLVTHLTQDGQPIHGSPLLENLDLLEAASC